MRARLVDGSTKYWNLSASQTTGWLRERLSYLMARFFHAVLMQERLGEALYCRQLLYVCKTFVFNGLRTVGPEIQVPAGMDLVARLR